MLSGDDDQLVPIEKDTELLRRISTQYPWSAKEPLFGQWEDQSQALRALYQQGAHAWIIRGVLTPEFEQSLATTLIEQIAKINLGVGSNSRKRTQVGSNNYYTIQCN